MMFKFLVTVSAVSCAAVFAVMAAPASASTTSTLEATFQHHFGAGVAPPPCPAGYFCETGTVAGYGEATDRVRVTDITPVPGTECFDFTTMGTITLADGSTLTYEGTGTRCPIGNSHDAPGAYVSYGNPYNITGAFTITGGTGVFAGASGSGTVIDYFAGDVEVTVFTGTITLP
jgi:hypothetical protein